MITYNKFIWEDGKTLINASKMNHLENGLVTAYKTINELEKQILELKEEIEKLKNK